MRTRAARSTALLFAALLLALGAFATTAAAQGDGAAKKVLRVGWAQEPQTLNPFIDQDEEDFVIWSISWNLLVNFSPKDLGPAPGIARSWDISPDKKTVTFHLFPGAKWSDGQPITSDDVKYSLETLGGNGALFTSYTDSVSSIETPDPETVVIKTKKPDARLVGGIFVYIIPKHIWGKTPVKQLLGSYRPQFPLVGSGPYVATSFERGRIIRMERNPNFRGPKPKFDELQFIKYGSQDAVQRALQLGEIDLMREVDASGFARLGRQPNIKTVKAPSPSFTELAFNLCPRSICPDAKYNPAVQDRVVRQAIAYAVDRGRINTIANRGTSFIGHGLLPQYYKSFYQQPSQDYAYNPDEANRLLDAAGYTRGSDGIRSKGGTKLSFNLYVRSESNENIQAAKLVAEMTRKVGIEFKVQVVSVDKLTELTTQKKNGKMAPDFDTFIWGWGGDPYDPSILLNLLTTKAIGGSSDSFYSNPEYDRLYDEQSGQFDVAARKGIVRQMIDIAQRDLPYLVLTVDPALQAYRTDRIANVTRQCPQPDGDIVCDQVSYAPFLTMAPATAKAADGGGSSTAVIVVVVVVVVAIVALLLLRGRRRRSKREPLELET
jgi:peptide/nickel transport system substrate-binding protein